MFNGTRSGSQISKLERCGCSSMRVRIIGPSVSRLLRAPKRNHSVHNTLLLRAGGPRPSALKRNRSVPNGQMEGGCTSRCACNLQATVLYKAEGRWASSWLRSRHLFVLRTYLVHASRSLTQRGLAGLPTQSPGENECPLHAHHI